MSRKFTRVVRYRCEWCGREFRTDRLHDCKFDPDKRNCLSCRHQIGDFDVREDDGCGHFHRESFFQCDALGAGYCDFVNSVADLCGMDWRGRCDSYELVDGWAGVETFKARRLALLDKENARAKEDFPWL